MKPVFLFILAILICGYTSQNVTAQYLDPQVGFTDHSRVKPRNHLAAALFYAEGTLRSSMMDPIGMRLDSSETSRVLKLGVCESGAVGKKQRYKLWATTVIINNTNIKGEYTGSKPYTLFFIDGEVVADEQRDIKTFDEWPTPDGTYFPCNGIG